VNAREVFYFYGARRGILARLLVAASSNE